MDKGKLLIDQDFLFLAFRYALGRKTYVVSMVVDELIKQWPNLNDANKSKIKTEIEQAIYEDLAGWDCDVVEWKKILNL